MPRRDNNNKRLRDLSPKRARKSARLLKRNAPIVLEGLEQDVDEVVVPGPEQPVAIALQGDQVGNDMHPPEGGIKKKLKKGKKEKTVPQAPEELVPSTPVSSVLDEAAIQNLFQGEDPAGLLRMAQLAERPAAEVDRHTEVSFIIISCVS